VLTKVNVAQCETQLLYERGKFQTTHHDLTEPLGARVIGATVFEHRPLTDRPDPLRRDTTLTEEWTYRFLGAALAYHQAEASYSART
jgi:hypothetical protein